MTLFCHSQLQQSSIVKVPRQSSRLDLASSTFNPEFSLLRLVQPYTALQSITHKAIICPSPIGSSGILLCSWIIFRSHSQLQFSHLPVCQLFSSWSSHIAMLCQKSLPYSLSQGQEALLSFAQRWLQPVPGTLPTGWLPKQANQSVPNANLLIQLLSPLHFFNHLPFSQVAAALPPPPLQLSKPLSSPDLPPSTLLHFILSAYSCKHLPSLGDSLSTAGSWTPLSPCCTAIRIPQNVNCQSFWKQISIAKHTKQMHRMEHTSAWIPAEKMHWQILQQTRTKVQVGPWRARALAAIMHQRLHPHALLTPQPASRNGSVYDNRIFLSPYRGITSFLAQCLPFDPLAPTQSFLDLSLTAWTSTALLIQPGRPLQLRELLPDCSAALWRLLGCVMVISS